MSSLALLELGVELLALLPLFHLAGLVLAYRAIVHTRTAQGAIAWVVSLLLMPYLAVPLYAVFGRRKFRGYMAARRAGDSLLSGIARELQEHEEAHRSRFEPERPELAAAEQLAKLPFVAGNAAELLVDGEAIFASILEAVRGAREYILAQFYIVRDDGIGRELQALLVERAREGVRVYFLYDEIGCYSLPEVYLDTLREAGVHVHAFISTRGPNNRFQINFRNHRKVVVVDGEAAWVGGANVGDEYMGRDPRYGAWRDTQVRLEGPIVQCVQLAFVEDWFFAAGGVPDLDWSPRPAPDGDLDVLALPSGPADELETAWLFYVQAIHSARKRLWIASPYFVPDETVVGALQLAALRGVDVRILLPERPDHTLVWLSSFAYLEELCGMGVKIHRYQPGFLHQKVMLVDDATSVVGTVNLDNRSFRLNFEITIAVLGSSFARRMEAMFEADFARSEEVGVRSLEERPWWFELAAKASRLMAPVQ